MRPSPFGKNALKKHKARYETGPYTAPKWLEFCEHFLSRGFLVEKYQARNTVSKYIYVTKDELTTKVRFSNHRPNYQKQQDGDCDFFVGVSNGQVTTTEQVIEKIEKLYTL